MEGEEVEKKHKNFKYQVKKSDETTLDNKVLINGSLLINYIPISLNKFFVGKFDNQSQPPLIKC